MAKTALYLGAVEIIICLVIQCTEEISATVTDDEIKQLSADMLRTDKNTASLEYHLQGKQRTSSNPQTFDLASEPLFETVPNTILQRSTYAKFIKLLDNYQRKVEEVEVVTPEEENEMNDFLNTITNTEVMKKLKNFLVQKGYLSSNENFQQALYNLWFKLYPRDKKHVKGSSGFEHVFVGEIKNRAISGLHNWIRFYLLEQQKTVNYEGFFVHLSLEPPVAFLKLKFSWDTFTKPTSSMLIGSSPEFEMALYTLCFYTRPNKKCHVTLGKKTLGVQTYVLDYEGEKYIGSAYPTT